jgi:DNA-binding CsgD family transcriptional regulator
MAQPAQRLGKPLSPREIEVVQLYARGLKRGEIAQRLGLANRTVDAYGYYARMKLGAKTIPQLLYRYGLVREQVDALLGAFRCGHPKDAENHMFAMNHGKRRLRCRTRHRKGGRAG